jgi:hypothetical protein
MDQLISFYSKPFQLFHPSNHYGVDDEYLMGSYTRQPVSLLLDQVFSIDHLSLRIKGIARKPFSLILSKPDF